MVRPPSGPFSPPSATNGLIWARIQFGKRAPGSAELSGALQLEGNGSFWPMADGLLTADFEREAVIKKIISLNYEGSR